MIKMARVFVVLLLISALLIAYQTEKNQIDSASAQNRTDLQSPYPVLTTLEAQELPGYTVTIKAKVASNPQLLPEGKFRILLQDGVGTILLITSQPVSLHIGDSVQATGRLSTSDHAIVMTVQTPDLVVITPSFR